MPELKKEIRSFGGDSAPKVAEGSRHIEGYAIVFNQRSQLLFDWNSGQPVYEIISPDAINDELLRSCDIKALLEHNPGRMLARSRNGAGSLSLEIDSHGLKYSFDAPNTSEGDYALEEIKRGDYFGSSFCYTDSDVSYSKEGDALIRTVKKIDQLFDVSIVSDPAYMTTSVETRSIAEILNPDLKNQEELEKRNHEEFVTQLKELRTLSK